MSIINKVDLKITVIMPNRDPSYRTEIISKDSSIVAEKKLPSNIGFAYFVAKSAIIAMLNIHRIEATSFIGLLAIKLFQFNDLGFFFFLNFHFHRKLATSYWFDD